ncbi:MAG: DUF3327 domain-containing protein [Thermoplasmata archaeon]|nr:DUF3327 domain-containing protein [Thermoplasmata archaeon]
MKTRHVESRRLASFRRACRHGGQRTLELNWKRLAQSSLPLVERIRDDPQKWLVTFVWRPADRVTAPSVYTPVADLSRNETELRPLGCGGVWYRSFSLSRKTRLSYGFSRQPIPDLSMGMDAWNRYMKSVVPDPFNPNHIDFDKDPDDPTDYALTLSVAELPGAPRQPWARLHGPSRWTEDCHHIRSRKLRNVRSIWVYLPSGFQPRRVRYNLLVVFDGSTYRNSVPTPRIVENLVDTHRIGPTALVLVGNARDARTKDLFLNPALADFLARELLPWLRRRYRLSTDASRTVLAGSSLGGLASVDVAFRYPRVFGNVLAQSGSFQAMRSGGGKVSPSLMRGFALTPRLPLRFYLDVGTHEGMTGPGSPASLLGSVRHMRDVLQAKGYPVAYAEFEGGHDYVCWRGTLADGIIYLLGRS